LQHSYPTLGIDRALALWGAGEVYGWPVLVIDAGTALTFTGGAQRQLVGGAILPGLSLQVRALADKTAALPAIALPETLPKRWANDTQGAIASGIVYMVLAGVMDFIQDWRQAFPGSAVVITGGDRTLLHQYLHQHPELAAHIHIDPNLIFWGMQTCRTEPDSAGSR
ncbi:MAG TPA: type III pantothenate kinase, partial [Candidatus Obscuribacterales bacterium]